MPFTLTNGGPGGALTVQIGSIAAIQVLSGSGAVAAQLGSPAQVGDLATGASAIASVPFVWPSTATRVRMTVNFSANAGAYQVSAHYRDQTKPQTARFPGIAGIARTSATVPGSGRKLRAQIGAGCSLTAER